MLVYAVSVLFMKHCLRRTMTVTARPIDLVDVEQDLFDLPRKVSLHIIFVGFVTKRVFYGFLCRNE